ncbi:uncharacterized protein LOC134833664 [Culicoides brevitarsis]|uniref:uncharacterized protein LOC134833664 n=1 Tax=Culicoides brevitarsis TaxID=469753 RepID=UPI00307C642D
MSVFIRTKVKEEENSVDYNNNEKSETSSNTSSNPLNKSVRLSLNKPKEWKWELSTSKSSPHIAFPLIQLYDSGTGNLLVEADDDECVFQGNEQLEKATVKGVDVPVDHFRPRAKTIHESLRESKSSKLEVPLSRSKSGSSRKSLLEAIEKDVVNKFVEQLKEQGIRCNVRSRSVSKARSIVDEPIVEEEPKVVSNLNKEKTPDLLRVPNALNKSKSAAEIPRKHKKYSRSSSSVRFTSSFLQRVSECRDDSSSTSDSELLEEARQSKRYYYRSSKAGTLLLCEDSFNNKKKRRENGGEEKK